jgi:uncharacterized membrane protein YqiK
MTHGITLQTDREIRYEQRFQRRRIEQQNVDRTIRLEIRENNKTADLGSISEIADEVSNEIIRLTQKRMNSRNNRYSNFVSSFF